MLLPPLTYIVCPVMNRLSSPARKATAAATSAGLPGRPIGTMAVPSSTTCL